MGCGLSGWLSDKYGRILALQLGALWCMLGIALEASAQNQNWIICARVIAGIGVAHMNCVAPTWVGVCRSYRSDSHHVDACGDLNSSVC